ncbi:MAG: hypothetical protein Q7J54_01510 [Candidatus Woesearchaeota archaeon]|nr:hypothetical protein [Candidatus Woesearchaeota archaeon]
MAAKLNKKSQTEVLGLVIVVVLITFALLFAVIYIFSKQGSTIRERYIKSELASNTLSTLLGTTTDCNDYEIWELYADCAKSGNGRGDVLCATTGQYSCQHVNSIVRTQILYPTLKDRFDRDAFKFTACKANRVADEIKCTENIMLNITEGNCTTWYSANQPLQSASGLLYFRLDICGG